MIIGTTNTSDSVLVIAEIGNNHEGNFDVARQLVQAAADAGAGAVKFQTVAAARFVSPADKARYEKIKSFELNSEQFRELSDLARSLGLLFISTPLDLMSATFLEPMVDAYKIASGDNNFSPLIAQVLATNKPLIVSTGASDLTQVSRLVEFVGERWTPEQVNSSFSLLHCVSAYPVPDEQVNLRALEAFAEQFDFTIGYSDHTLGIEAAVLSVALGARIIEKHFTLDKHYSDFRDHQLSADPEELRQLVERIKLTEALLGAKEKAIQPCEADGCTAFRRSIVAAKDLPSGHVVAWDDLLWIRPGDGVSPGEEDKFVGKRLRHAVSATTQLKSDDVE